MKRTLFQRLRLPVFLFLFFGAGFIFCCSGLPFPFPRARSTLAGHLNRDFDLALPPSATVDHAQWIALRDPEHLFAFHMNPADIAPFFSALNRAALAKSATYDLVEPARAHALYPTPPWWTPAAITDPVARYGIVYSPTTGKIFLNWGEF